MQKTSNVDKGTSRRGFIRSATGLLLAAPAVSSLISCDKKESSKTTECPNAPQGAVPVAGNYIGGFGFFTHEPPVGGGSGSFFVELPYQLDNTILHAGDYDIHTMDKDGYTGIAEIKIITELKDQGEQRHVTDITYSPWGASEFWIWLEAAPGTSLIDCGTTSAPDVKLLCDSKLKIHIKNANTDTLNHEPTYKKSVPHRYKHTGKVLGDHFRIAKWAIVDSATQAPVDFLDICDKSNQWPGYSNGEDSYRFYVLLGDTTFRLRWL